MTLTLGGEYYCDPAVLEKERRTIFSRNWQLLCAEDRLAQPGDYFSTRMAGIGVFVIRGADGVIRGFKNACRHRGAQLLAEGTGHCAQIRCPYHDWHYDDRGALRATPWFDAPTPFELERYPLESVSVAFWRGLVFAALAPAQPLREQLGDLPDELKNVAMERFQTVEAQRFEAQVNWKAYLDQFVENYHVPRVHAPDKSVEIWKYTVTDRKNIVILAAPQGGMYFGGRWIWGWPNWTLSLFPGGMKLSRLEPLSPTSFEIYYQYLFEDLSEEGAAKRRRVIDATETIFRDDVRASELAQLNYNTGNFQPGPLHPLLENGVAYFQQRVRETLEVA